MKKKTYQSDMQKCLEMICARAVCPLCGKTYRTDNIDKDNYVYTVQWKGKPIRLCSWSCHKEAKRRIIAAKKYPQPADINWLRWAKANNNKHKEDEEKCKILP